MTDGMTEAGRIQSAYLTYKETPHVLADLCSSLYCALPSLTRKERQHAQELVRLLNRKKRLRTPKP
jgi:hypothetical protein